MSEKKTTGKDPCSKEYAEELCYDLGLPLECWGTLNDALCDAFFQGQQDIKRRLIGEENPVLNGDLNSQTIKVPTIKRQLDEI